MKNITNKVYNIIEHYTDEYQTLEQSIQYSVEDNNKSGGKVVNGLRSKINPNLTWNDKIYYLNRSNNIIRIEMYDINGDLIKIIKEEKNNHELSKENSR